MMKKRRRTDLLKAKPPMFRRVAVGYDLAQWALGITVYVEGGVTIDLFFLCVYLEVSL